MVIPHSEAQNVIGQVAHGLTRGEKLSAETAQELKPYLRYGGSITTIDPSTGQEVTSRVVRRTGYQGPADPTYATDFQPMTQKIVQSYNLNTATSKYSSGTFFNNVGQGFSIDPSVAESINAGTYGNNTGSSGSGTNTNYVGQPTFAPTRTNSNTPTVSTTSSKSNYVTSAAFSGSNTNLSKVSSSNPYLSSNATNTKSNLTSSKTAVKSMTTNLGNVTKTGTSALKNITSKAKSVFKF